MRKLRLDLYPTLVVDLVFWPGCMYFNFKYVPVKHQLLVANVCVLVWSLFMSLVCHDDELMKRLDPIHPSPHLEEDRKFLADHHRSA